MSMSYYIIPHLVLASWVLPLELKPNPLRTAKEFFSREFKFQLAPLRPLRQWIDQIQTDNPQLARRICHLVPAQCPFARVIQFRQQVLLRIPPLCKLNPLYEELMNLRFRALCYLADECGEDISPYLQ